MEKLLTQQDLADRWQVSTKTIREWRLEGIITPVKGIPAIRFTEKHIAELEGIKLEPVSPLQVRRLKSELENIKQENEKLKGIIANVLTETSKIVGMGVAK